jgi:hypothetical protein
MKEIGGVIINDAPIYGFVAVRKHIPYHASKGTLG